MRQTEALAILNAGANVFLTGAPGAGKTYVLNEFIRQARADGASVAVTASTGIASTHINGQTIHSWSGVGVATALSASLLNYIKSRRKRKIQATDSSSLTRFPCCTLGCSTWSTKSAAKYAVIHARSVASRLSCPATSSSCRRFRCPGATATSSPPRPNSSPVANGMPVPA